MNPKFEMGETVNIKGKVLAIQCTNPNTAAPDYYYQIDIGDSILHVHESAIRKIYDDNHVFIEAKETKEGHWK